MGESVSAGASAPRVVVGTLSFERTSPGRLRSWSAAARRLCSFRSYRVQSPLTACLEDLDGQRCDLGDGSPKKMSSFAFTSARLPRFFIFWWPTGHQNLKNRGKRAGLSNLKTWKNLPRATRVANCYAANSSCAVGCSKKSQRLFRISSHPCVGNQCRTIGRASSDVVEIGAAFLDALDHGELRFTNPLTRVVVALVWLIRSIWVADLSLKVALLGLVKVEQTLPVRPLGVSVHVHLHNTTVQGSGNVMLLGAGATMEHDEKRLVLPKLLGGVLLHLCKDLRLQDDITSLVDAVHIAEGSSDGELLGDWGELLIDRPRVLWRGVQLLLGNTAVVDAILNTASDANLHLQRHVHCRHALEVLRADGKVLLIRLLGEVKHVRAEERLTVRLEEGLVCLNQAIEPRQQLLGAVIGVQNHWDTIGRRDVTDVVSADDCSKNRSLQDALVVWQALACEERGATLRELDHDWPSKLLAGLEDGIDGAGGRAVEGRDGVLVGLSMVQETPGSIASDDARLHTWHIPEAHGC